MPATTYDIWWDPEGCWAQVGPQTLGPFESEQEAEVAAGTTCICSSADNPNDHRTDCPMWGQS